MVSRAGHSLPELIVAVTFLATTLVAVASTTLLGAREVSQAAARQAAARLASQVLDSVQVRGTVPGRMVTEGLEVRWTGTTVIGAPGVEVIVRLPHDGPVLATVAGPLWPAIPVLPGGDSAGGPSRSGVAAP